MSGEQCSGIMKLHGSTLLDCPPPLETRTYQDAEFRASGSSPFSGGKDQVAPAENSAVADPSQGPSILPLAGNIGALTERALQVLEWRR